MRGKVAALPLISSRSHMKYIAVVCVWRGEQRLNFGANYKVAVGEDVRCATNEPLFPH